MAVVAEEGALIDLAKLSRGAWSITIALLGPTLLPTGAAGQCHGGGAAGGTLGEGIK